jgi:hypothetical protein
MRVFTFDAELKESEVIMKTSQVINRVVIILGTVLVFLPVVAPLIFGLFSLAGDGIYRLDYLMPAELSFVVLVGGLLLLFGSFRMKAYRGLIGGLLAAAALLLFGSQVLAVVTGLADGSIEPTGWQFYVVMGGIVLYDLLVVALGVAGIWMVRSKRTTSTA